MVKASVCAINYTPSSLNTPASSFCLHAPGLYLFIFAPQTMQEKHLSLEPARILSTMLDNDSFSQWLGIVVNEYREGYCRLHFSIREDMLNGFRIVHGGILFSAADSAFAFACNSHGRISVALDAHISFIASAVEGDLLSVEAKEMHTGNKTSFYNITIHKGQQLVAAFKGTAYRTGKPVYEQ